ncbi:MAG: outer membrane lipoprotein-sorting protein [Proteobacteria bacterium]|nr:outer membrane lipoprotein-sorting protein [Pseudomonadota bacterium]
MKPASVALFLVLACLGAQARSQSGGGLIEESLRRHAQPADVYQEQAMVLSDRMGQRTVRTMRYYAQRDEDASRNLLVIETPSESKGTAILISRGARGGSRRGPAASSPVFGSNFSVADLEGEQPRDFRYERDDNQDVDLVPHYVVRAFPVDESASRNTGYHERKIYLRKDNLFVSRIDYHDREGHLTKRQTFRDPRPDESGAWRADMILMEDLRDGRRTLLKIERRVHSSDYVPAAVFAGLPALP